MSDANEIINNLCRKPIIEKTRHFVTDNAHVWEIDEFDGDNHGLIVAEIELDRDRAILFKTALAGTGSY